MKRIILCLVAICSLTGCLDAQKRQAALCRIESDRRFPSIVEAPDGQPWKFEDDCMAAAGYEHSYRYVECGKSGTRLDPYCYSPTSTFDRLLTDLQAEVAMGK